MAKLTIDGREVESPNGSTVIQAAEKLGISGNMMGTTICALSDAAAMPARAIVTKYRAEFEEHAALGRCPLRAPAEEPRLHAHA